jgi:hypothetical protein
VQQTDTSELDEGEDEMQVDGEDEVDEDRNDNDNNDEVEDGDDDDDGDGDSDGEGEVDGKGESAVWNLRFNGRCLELNSSQNSLEEDELNVAKQLIVDSRVRLSQEPVTPLMQLGLSHIGVFHGTHFLYPHWPTDASQLQGVILENFVIPGDNTHGLLAPLSRPLVQGESPSAADRLQDFISSNAAKDKASTVWVNPDLILGLTHTERIKLHLGIIAHRINDFFGKMGPPAKKWFGVPGQLRQAFVKNTLYEHAVFNVAVLDSLLDAFSAGTLGHLGAIGTPHNSLRDLHEVLKGPDAKGFYVRMTEHLTNPRDSLRELLESIPDTEGDASANLDNTILPTSKEGGDSLSSTLDDEWDVLAIALEKYESRSREAITFAKLIRLAQGLRSVFVSRSTIVKLNAFSVPPI